MCGRESYLCGGSQEGFRVEVVIEPGLEGRVSGLDGEAEQIDCVCCSLLERGRKMCPVSAIQFSGTSAWGLG